MSQDEIQLFSNISSDPLLNIKAVSQSTGIEPVTLRAWERRYGVPNPARSEQGYRLYSERDIAILRWLKAKVDAGVTIMRAVALLHSQEPSVGTSLVPSPAVSVSAGASFESMTAELIEAGRRFDTQQVQRVMTQAFALFSVEEVCTHLILPVLELIGERWESGDTSLQVEHFITGLIRQQLLAIGASLPLPSRPGRVIAGCAPGDWHEMGTLILTLFLRRRGFEVIYLGQAVGLDRLEEALDAVQPDVIILSASTIETVPHLPQAASIVAESGRYVWFTFGGTIFPHAPGLSDRIPGVYIGDTLIEAARRIDDLLTGQWQPVANIAWTQSDDIARAYESIKNLPMAALDDLTQLLLDADPDLTPVEASDIVRQAVMELTAALKFELPELLNAPTGLLGHPLGCFGISADRLNDMFSRYLPPSSLAALEPYLVCI
ncbi:MAG: cobalamin-dependent protein [Anaerolineae bacterium]|nr:cobalamin-dependent protein [Anaerolineae bacterium]